jgi:fibronectin-binding autotransporter adhesin
MKSTSTKSPTNVLFATKSLLIACALSGALALAPVASADLRWDADPETPDAQYGDGTWSTTNATWWDTAKLENVAWTNSNSTSANVVFGGEVNTAPATVTVTLGEAITANQISMGSAFASDLVITNGGDASRTLTNSYFTTNQATKTMTIDAVITGSQNVYKVQQGAVIFTQNNTYTGNTYIRTNTTTAKALQIGNNTTTGSLGTGVVIFEATLPGAGVSELAFKRADDITVSNRFIYNGNVTLVNGGTTGRKAIVSNQSATGNVILTGRHELVANDTGVYPIVEYSAVSKNLTLTGVISVDEKGTSGGGIYKSGAGTLELTAANTYVGTTVIGSGTFLASNTTGSATGSSTVTINSGATLGGSGNLAGATTVAGVLRPGSGDTTAILSFGDTLTLGDGASLDLRIKDTANYDAIAVTGALSLSNTTLNLSLDGLVAGSGAVFTIATYASLSGTFLDLANGATVTLGGADYIINYGANRITLQMASAVPEPATVAMLAALAALAAAGVVRRRRCCGGCVVER